jgi:hypothetical protein
MAKFTNSLESLHIAAPCKADWDDMIGDARVRFCGQCQKNVYNLSNMTRREAERLVANKEGSMCVRFYKRADGTVITANCPIGLRNLKRRVSRIASAMISAVLSFITGIGIHSGFTIIDVDSSAIPPVSLDMKVDEQLNLYNGQVQENKVEEDDREKFSIVEGGI